jgi:hypothetical protein
MTAQLPDFESLQQRLAALEQEWKNTVNAHIKQQEAEFHYHLEKGKVQFEAGFKRLQSGFKQGILAYLASAPLKHVLSAPVIYAMVIPIAFIDLTVTLYQHICFRAYGIQRVKRSEYIVIDRQYLAYLNWIEKLNCIYCGYGNGVVSYAREIIARTEQFWCPIRHASRVPDPHRLTANFVDYGDAQGFRDRLTALRNDLQQAQINESPQSDKPHTS